MIDSENSPEPWDRGPVLLGALGAAAVLTLGAAIHYIGARLRREPAKTFEDQESPEPQE